MKRIVYDPRNQNFLQKMAMPHHRDGDELNLTPPKYSNHGESFEG